MHQIKSDHLKITPKESNTYSIEHTDPDSKSELSYRVYQIPVNIQCGPSTQYHEVITMLALTENGQDDFAMLSVEPKTIESPYSFDVQGTPYLDSTHKNVTFLLTGGQS